MTLGSKLNIHLENHETGVSKSNTSRAAQLLKLKTLQNNSNPGKLCSRAIQLPGFVSAVGIYTLESKVRSIRNWHSFLLKRGFTCRVT
jgi:hypothetical protein